MREVSLFMKRYKLKKWHIVCSVILSVMICFSGFIGMVITGVVAQGNIDGTLKYNIGNNNTQNANVNNNTVNNDAAYYDDNGTVVYDDNNSSADYSGDTNNGNAVSNGNTNNSTVGSQSHQPSNNNAGGNSGSTNTNTQTAVVNKNNLPTNPTKADIVNIYATLMNKAKADKPGFTKVEYQELPGDPAN